MTRRSFLTTAAMTPLFASAMRTAGAQGGSGERLFYVGTYTNNTGSKGIYAWRFQASTGKATSLGLAAETDSPSFLAVHPGKKLLYAVNELGQPGADPTGAVSAFSIDAASGKLTLLNRVKSRGINPAHITVDPTGKWVIIGNYGNGAGTEGTSVAVFRVKADGGLEDEPKTFIPHAPRASAPDRQPAAHPHNVVLSPDARFLLVADKGLDQIVVYRWDANAGTLTPNSPPAADAPKPGSGPRHLAFGRGAKFVYVCHEQGRSVSTYSYDASRGALKLLDTVSTLPDAAPATGSTAEIEVHPDGTFLYVSNRGHDSLALFAIDSSKGTLTPKGHIPTGGKTPRNFKIDPTGAYLFAENQNSALTVVFKIDRKTGQLTQSGTTLDSPGPVCIAFV